MEKHGIELIGASPAAIEKAEDRLKFKEAMEKLGLGSARSGIAYSLDEALKVQSKIGFPAIIRPEFYTRRLRRRNCFAQHGRVRADLHTRVGIVSDSRAFDRRIPSWLERVRDGSRPRF